MAQPARKPAKSARDNEARPSEWLTIVQIKTTTYTITTTDKGLPVFLCDAAGGAFTITLPALADWRSLACVCIRKNSGANAVTVAAAGGETINGAASVALAAQGEALFLWAPATGTDWIRWKPI